MPKLEMQVISPRIQTKQNTKHKKKKQTRKIEITIWKMYVKKR